MKKFIIALLALALLAGTLSGCGGGTDGAAESGDGGRLSVVTTIFPVYDWVREILGDRAGETDLTMLMDSGVDLHNFQVTADDIIRIGSCDMFIYVGGASDGWVEDTLAQATNKNMVVIDLMEALGDKAKEEEVVEGMQDEEHDHDHEESGGAEDGPEYDEHVWLSLKNAAFYCQYIAGKLAELDPDNASVYEANAGAYIDKLEALDGEYQQAVDGAARDTLLFGDRFPFRYMADDYGLKYYAAFSGCSAESEASFETITFLAEKADELDLDVILQIETSDGSIPNTIRETTQRKDQTVLTMDSMQSKTAADVEAGASYLAVMESNLDVLRQALAREVS